MIYRIYFCFLFLGWGVLLSAQVVTLNKLEWYWIKDNGAYEKFIFEDNLKYEFFVNLEEIRVFNYFTNGKPKSQNIYPFYLSYREDADIGYFKIFEGIDFDDVPIRIRFYFKDNQILFVSLESKSAFMIYHSFSNGYNLHLR